MTKIVIDDKIFEQFPEFYRGLIIINDIDNKPDNPAISQLLADRLTSLKPADSGEESRIKAWDEVHRKFGSNPNKYPPSIKSLLKRIDKKPQLPFINSVVALFNYISIKYKLPCGGDDTDTIKGDLVLGIADGIESFRGLGSSKTEHPHPGEVIYFDSESKNIMCRRWNWRNSDDTKIETGSKRIIVNLDCIPPTTTELTNSARDELASLLEEHCSARLQTAALWKNKRTITV